MSISRLKALREMAEISEDIDLQFMQESFPEEGLNKEEIDASFMKWAGEQAERYIPEEQEKPDEKEIDELAEEIDF